MGKWSHLKGVYANVEIDADTQAKIDTVLDSPAEKTEARLKLELQYAFDFAGELQQTIIEAETVDHIKIRDLDNERLHELYIMVRRREEQVNQLSSTVALEKEALTREFINRFEEDGVSSMTFKSGLSIGTSPEPYPVVQDGVKMMAWIKENKLDDLLSLNYQTMASLVKQRLIDGKELPPGIDVFIKDKLSARGLKNVPKENA